MKSAIKLTAIAAVGLVVLGTSVVAAEADVTVLRGTVSKPDPDADSRPAAVGPVTVLRGWPPGAKRKPATPARRRAASGWIATGGNTLWLVERGGGRLIGCWLQGSTRAGQTDIRCGQRGLR